MAETAKLVGTMELQLALPGGQTLRVGALELRGLVFDGETGVWRVELSGQSAPAAPWAPPPAVKPVTPAPPAPGPAEKPKG